MAQMNTFAIRLPDATIQEVTMIAGLRYIPTRTMVRGWVMERLEHERERAAKHNHPQEVV